MFYCSLIVIFSSSVICHVVLFCNCASLKDSLYVEEFLE